MSLQPRAYHVRSATTGLGADDGLRRELEEPTRLVIIEGGIPVAYEPAALEHGMEPASVGFLSSAESGF